MMIVYMVRVWVMVFKATFNNISAISSWQSVLLVEETGVPRENQRPVASHIVFVMRLYNYLDIIYILVFGICGMYTK
jgi:hypothetical protein